jgi:DNA polymerase-3 subunit delta'
MKFADVVGHAPTCGRLASAARRNRLPHAYLFAGPDGIGKFAVARALATYLACDAADDDACGTCSGCLGANREAHPDLVVVRRQDGAAEIKIDQVRELQRRLRLHPVRARHKVAIFDEAHRLNLAAQNALLKTLEEPPGATLLILVASNVGSLLPTVLSRCQRVNFFPLPDDAVERLLVERHEVAPDQARDLASFAGGSVGEALIFRTELIERARTELLPLLPELGTRPYADLVELAQDWGRIPATDLTLLLRAPLAWYRQRLAETAAAGPHSRRSREALSQLRTVYDTIERLRRNAHRQLTLDTMFLELRSAARRAAIQGEQSE